MDVERLAQRFRSADIHTAPFSHMIVQAAFGDDEFASLKTHFPELGTFDVKGRGRKLELDIIESDRALGGPGGAATAARLASRPGTPRAT